ncbi:MAG: c-type cytochrome [Nitrospirae bacterium]|nr:c-type cytochrome [Nitrospirota bacterium]
MKLNRREFKPAARIFFLALLSWSLISAAGTYAADSKTAELGKKVYDKRCVICHGSNGDGKGLVGIVHRYQKKGAVQSIYPRDFTTGVFRFRTTSTGCLPTDEDILKVVTNGIPRAYMPSHQDVPLDERNAVVQYIKTFSKRWKEEEACKPIAVKKPDWVGSIASVEKGKQIYKDMKCWECHGYEGKGDGTKADQLKDDWGDKILPFDFTSGATKMGFAPENVFTAYTTGLDGAGMPSFEDSMNEEDRWHLVSYTLVLMGRAKQ